MVLVVTRLADLIIDPAIGAMSDQTRTGIGRRKPWVIAGLSIVTTGMWFLFEPPAAVSPLYLLVALFLINLGSTVTDLPYAAWCAELSDDYNGRSRVAAWRGGFSSIGSLVALSVPVALDMAGRPDTEHKLYWIANLYVASQPIAFLARLLLVKEPPLSARVRDPASFSSKLRLVRSNRPFMILIAANVLFVAGAPIGGALNQIAMTHIARAPELFSQAVFWETTVALLALPGLIYAASRIGKYRALALAAVLYVWTSLLNLAWGPSDGRQMAAIIVTKGIPFGAVIFFCSAMVADLVDVNTARTGETHTLLWLASMALSVKLAIIIGVALGLILPGLAGFQPFDASHTPQALFALQLTFALVTPVLILPAILSLRRYPITQAAHAMIREQLASRRTVLQD